MALKIDVNLPVLRQYDKLLAIGSLIVLLISLFYLTSAGAARKQEESNYISRLENLAPAVSSVSALDKSSYEEATQQIRAPYQLAMIEDGRPGLLAPERRVTCVNAECQRPIPYAARSCPFCSAEQPIPADEDPKLDSDGDGLPDRVEIAWGLNPNDVADAAGDLDGDGFSNLEEYRAGTDPRDPKAHPDLVSTLRVKEVRGKPLPITFIGVNTMPDSNLQLIFNVTGPIPRTFWVREGEAIGNSGYTAGKVEVKFEERPRPNMPGIMSRVNVSTVNLKRQADDKTLTLTINEVGKETDVEAVFVLPRDHAEHTAMEGGSFKLRDETFRVLSIDPRAVSAVIENEKTGQQKVVPKLD